MTVTPDELSDEEAALTERVGVAALARAGRPPRHEMFLLAVQGAGFLAFLAAVDIAGFAALGGSYVEWYVANAAGLAVAIAVLSGAGVDLDRDEELISPHPYEYLAGWVWLLMHWSLLWAPPVSADRHSLSRSPTFDSAVARLLQGLTLLGLMAYFIVAAPPQYLLNLVFGAPARHALGSGKVLWSYTTVPTEPRQPVGLVWHWLDATDRKPRPGAKRVGFDSRPVTLTHALTAVALWILSSTVAA